MDGAGLKNEDESRYWAPLVPRAIEILQLMKAFNSAAYVFPGRFPGEPLSQMSFLMALRRLGYETETVHGMRASFKTWSETETEVDSLVIEASMAHQVQGIERHYLRTDFFPQPRKLMNAWAKFEAH